ASSSATTSCSSGAASATRCCTGRTDARPGASAQPVDLGDVVLDLAIRREPPLRHGDAGAHDLEPARPLGVRDEDLALDDVVQQLSVALVDARGVVLVERVVRGVRVADLPAGDAVHAAL